MMSHASRLVCFILLLVALLASPVWFQDRDTIIAKAKEEKEFVYYSTTDIRDGTAGSRVSRSEEG